MPSSSSFPGDGENIQLSVRVDYGPAVDGLAPLQDPVHLVLDGKKRGPDLWIGRDGHVPVRNVFDGPKLLTSRTIVNLEVHFNRIEIRKGRYRGLVVVDQFPTQRILDARHTYRAGPDSPTYPDKAVLEPGVTVARPRFSIAIPDLVCKLDIEVELTTDEPDELVDVAHSGVRTAVPVSSDALSRNAEVAIRTANLHFLVFEIFADHYCPGLTTEQKHSLLNDLTQANVIERFGDRPWVGRAAGLARSKANEKHPLGLTTSSSVKDLVAATQASGVPLGLLRGIGDEVYVELRRRGLLRSRTARRM